MRKLTLYRKDKVIGSITFNDGQYTIEAISENLRMGLDSLIKRGISCKRSINLEEAIEKHTSPDIIEIDADPLKENFFEQAKLYFELSFDTICTITEE